MCTYYSNSGERRNAKKGGKRTGEREKTRLILMAKSKNLVEIERT